MLGKTVRITLILAILAMVAASASAQMTATVGNNNQFTLRFAGVQYDWTNHTSTWSYGFTWNGEPHALSHLTMELCAAANVIAVTNPFGLGYDIVDPSLANSTDPPPNPPVGAVIKWYVPGGDAFPVNQEVIFTFTLDGTYAVTPGVRFFAKASTDKNEGAINGPSLGCTVADPKIDVEKVCVPEAFVGESVTYDITVTNTGNVDLSNVHVVDALVGLDHTIPTLAVGASVNYKPTYTSNVVGEVPNTVTADGTYWDNHVTGSSGCSTTFYALGVSKTATTSYTRDWDWTINKSVDQNSVRICGTDSATLNYTVDVTRTATDSAWAVTGVIMVTNPAATIGAPLVGVSDVFNSSALAVSCGVTFPYTLPAGQTLVCSYSANLNSAVDGINTATATLMSGPSFLGTADVVFGSPTTELDPAATVIDAVTCPDGFTCTAAGPFRFAGSGTINFPVTVTKAGAYCNSYFDVVNTATLTESEGSHSSAASTQIYTCECPTGCTLTIGYWKTHAGFTGNNPDNVTQYLPIWLGTAGGLKSVQVVDATQAVNVLSFGLGQASNGITKLYAQLLGAKFNIARGASSADVNDVISKSDAFLALRNQDDWAGLRKNEKTSVLTWMTLLDAYNNGDIGPGHCD